MISIYGLRDGPSGIIRYVGSTQNAKARLAGHKSPPASCQRALAEWLHGCADLQMVTLEVVTRDTRYAREAHWLSVYGSSGLLNINKPGREYSQWFTADESAEVQRLEAEIERLRGRLAGLAVQFGLIRNRAIQRCRYDEQKA